MFEKLANIFRVPELRTRVLFTLGLLAVYRVGGHIPTPGINADLLQQFFEQQRGSFLGFVDLFSGGQLKRLTIFALGIMPYITASIILQLLTVVYEPVDTLSYRGPGRTPVHGNCLYIAAWWWWRAVREQSRLGLRHHDCDYPDSG